MRLSIFRVALLACFSLTAANVTHGYEIVNHADMSQESALLSVFGKDTGPSGKAFRLGLKPRVITDPVQTFPLQPNFPDIRECFGEVKDKDGNVIATGVQPLSRDQYQIAQLFRYGACFEDNESILTGLRPLAHFYDPQHNGRGMTGGPSSPDWVLTRTGYTNNTQENHFTYMDARDAFYKALTRDSAGGANTPADRALDRRAQWAVTFQSLGHVVHHLQDMAQPQHTRHDDHCDATIKCGLLGKYKPSAYEKYLQSRAEFVRTLASYATTPILFGLPREFWSMQGDSITGHYPPNQGIAAYTATNFVSAGSDFTLERVGPSAVPKPAYDFAFPVPAPQSNDVTLATLFQGTAVSDTTFIRDQLCAGDLANCKMRFYGSDVERNARKSSVSLFSQDLLGGAGGPTGGRPNYFTQNYWTYAEAASDLIPRAVEYSAGLINYFFRGELEISLPEEGVYGVIDHAVEKNKGTDGFRFIKMKVKNTTAALATARGLLPQDMTNGEFRAVAKFRRNTCYTANLSGQIGTVGTGAGATTNFPSNCRSLVDEIVVSSPEPVIQSLAADGVAVSMGFDFPSPIPIEATDLYLQIVFKGKLGEEGGAVAVTTKDVSEPSFIGFMDATDYRLCAASWVANPDPYALLGCADWNPDAGPAPITHPMTTSPDGQYNAAVTPEYGRWLGTSNDNNVVVARLPAAGFGGGNFVRMAVITDANLSDLPLRHGAGSHSQLPTIKGLRDGPFPVNDIDYWRWDSQVALTKVQADDNGPVPDTVSLSSLPSYWQPRGVVLGAMRDRGEDGKNDLPVPVIYRGEPLWGGDPATYTANLPTQGSNVSVLSRTYYPTITATPVPLDRIAFARGAINRVPATYESIATQLTAANAGIGFEAVPLWVYFNPKGYAWRHTMSQRALKKAHCAGRH